MEVIIRQEIIDVKEINEIGNVRILMVKGEKGDVGPAPTDAQILAAVETVLENHPEWTTTVEDHSISERKLENTLADKINRALFIDSDGLFYALVDES